MKPFNVALTVAGLAALFSGPWVIPKAIQSAHLLAQRDDVVAIAEYQLSTVPPRQFQDAIDQALVDGDPELAASLVEVAAGGDTPVSADLSQRVADAQGFDVGRTAGDVWNGFFKGDTASEAALSGSFVADMTGVGDARDLVREGNSYLTTGSYDPVVLTLSVVGLASTVTTYLTAGSAAPVRTGLTVLKAAKKAGSLPDPLVRELGELAVRSIDGVALDEAITAAKRFDYYGAGTAAGRILNPRTATTISKLADDVSGIAGKSGYRAVNQTLRAATSTADISKLRRLADATGTRYRGTLKILSGVGAVGGVVLSVASFAIILGGWALSGFVWLLTAGFAIFGFAHRGITWMRRRGAQQVSTPASPV